MHEALLECFPMSKVRKNKEYIPDSISECTKEGRALCKTMYRDGRRSASSQVRAILAGWKICCSSDNAAKDIHSWTVEGADGTDGTRPYISIVSSTIAGARGTDGTRPYTWHSVFGVRLSSF